MFNNKNETVWVILLLSNKLEIIFKTLFNIPHLFQKYQFR